MNNNNNAGSVSPSISPTPTGGPVSSNSNVYLIGLEFVRQYYTVLHQGPLYLHRFYSEQSTFVHDDSKVVYGQQEIRDRIEQLNFRNCVAKILQVLLLGRINLSAYNKKDEILYFPVFF